jgi:demethylmenaquinone methyltransferase/2-methoxy-6-polyprenyl-1,4-benzoquinol methylase
MFETIAGTYDFQNSFLSLRRDVYWRKVLAQSIRLHNGGTVLDVAVGTAEVALEICRCHPEVRVIGVDFSPAMLTVGRRKIEARKMADRIKIAVGDGRRLPVRSNAVDALTISFGIRNIEERDLVLAEFHRVLRPGGQLLIMEFSYPNGPLLGRLYRLYFDHILPPVGNFISRTNYAYRYLSDSVDGFPHDEGFLDEIGRAGFTELGIQELTFGIAKIYHGIKKETA